MRRSEKEIKDKAVIIDVLNRCHIGRLGTIGRDGYPIVKPLNFAYYNATLNPPSSPFFKGGKEGDFSKGGKGGFADGKIYFHTAKEIADVLPPETLTFWGFFITFISLSPVLFLIKGPMQLSRSALFYSLLGSVLTGLYLYLFFVGLKNGLAGAAGVLVTTMIPIMTFALSIPIFRQRASYKDFSGLALGVMSGGILLEIWKLKGDKLLMSGNIYFLLCIILWASLNICSKKAGDFVSPLVFSIFTYAFCSILFFFLALPQGIMAVFEQGQFFWLNMLYLAIISSGFATTIFFFCYNPFGFIQGQFFYVSCPVDCDYL